METRILPFLILAFALAATPPASAADPFGFDEDDYSLWGITGAPYPFDPDADTGDARLDVLHSLGKLFLTHGLLENIRVTMVRSSPAKRWVYGHIQTRWNWTSAGWESPRIMR